MKDNPSIDKKNGGNVSSQKRGLLKDPGTDFDGGFNRKAGTRGSKGGKLEDRWQGKTKGKTKHTYEND